MTDPFVGAGLPLDEAGLEGVLAALDTGAAELWSVLTVETAGCGFTAARQPRILFERHKFSQFTGGRYDAGYPDISNPQPGGYGKLDAQYERLERAVALDRDAALKSASWGIGQIMGYNAPLAGYAGAQDMVAAMMASETNQLLAMAGFLKSSKLDAALRQRDWAGFAKGYNGVDYAKNQYDQRLAAAYQKYAGGGLPDLQVRAAQMLLTYLGYAPGAIDGMPGKLTRSALAAFLADQGQPAATAIDASTLALLQQCVAAQGA